MEKENTKIENVEPNIDELKLKIAELKIQKKEKKDLVEINMKEFKEFMSNKFKKFDINGDIVYIDDSKNSYKYYLSNNIICMKKNPNYNKFHRSPFGFHPMDFILNMMEIQEKEQEEIFYGGNKIPKSKTVEDYYEILKNDILTNGEICETIKKYIGIDREMRIENDKQSDNIQSEINKLERQVKTLEEKEKQEKAKLEKERELYEELKQKFDGDQQ